MRYQGNVEFICQYLQFLININDASSELYLFVSSCVKLIMPQMLVHCLNGLSVLAFLRHL